MGRSSFSVLIKAVLLLLGAACLTACNSDQGFSSPEKQLINSGSGAQPMRVLTIDNKEDSLILRKRSVDIGIIKGDPTLALLLDRMRATMNEEDGIGIAAPQIGINRNIFLFVRMHEPGQKVQVAINPKILAHSEELICFERDGCLSIPDLRGNSKRYSWTEVSYYDENGVQIKEKLSGYKRPQDFTNVIFQHEYDHINGVLFIDKLCQ